MKCLPLLLAAGLFVLACQDDSNPHGPNTAADSAPGPDGAESSDGSSPSDGPSARDGSRRSDVAPPLDAALPMDDAAPVPAERDFGPPALVHRAPCFEGEPVDPGLVPMASDCLDLFARSADRESGCYLLDDGLGAPTAGYCWRKRVLVLLVNNDIETPIHPEDLDEDGVIDTGDFAGTNFPPDPFGIPPADVAAEMRQQIHDYFSEMSYGALSLEVTDVHWEQGQDGRPDRWFRLQRERPSFANDAQKCDAPETRSGNEAYPLRHRAKEERDPAVSRYAPVGRGHPGDHLRRN